MPPPFVLNEAALPSSSRSTPEKAEDFMHIDQQNAQEMSSMFPAMRFNNPPVAPAPQAGGMVVRSNNSRGFTISVPLIVDPFPNFPINSLRDHVRRHMSFVGEKHRYGEPNPPLQPYTHSPYTIQLYAPSLYIQPPYNHSPYGPRKEQKRPSIMSRYKELVDAANTSRSEVKHNFFVGEVANFPYDAPFKPVSSWHNNDHYHDNDGGGDDDDWETSSSGSGSDYTPSPRSRHKSTFGKSKLQFSLDKMRGDKSSRPSKAVRRSAAAQNMQLAPYSQDPPRRGQRQRAVLDYKNLNEGVEASISPSSSSPVIAETPPRKTAQRTTMKQVGDESDEDNGNLSSPPRADLPLAPRPSLLDSAIDTPELHLADPRPLKRRKILPSSKASTNYADDEDTHMYDTKNIVNRFRDQSTPSDTIDSITRTDDSRRHSSTSSSSLSSLDDRPCPDIRIFDSPPTAVKRTLSPSRDGTAETDTSRPRASRRNATMQNSAVSQLKPAPIRKPRIPRVRITTPPEIRSSSPEYSSSPSQLELVPSPPRAAQDKRYMYHRKIKMPRYIKPEPSEPETLSRAELDKQLLKEGKGFPLSMGEIMSKNYYAPTVFAPRGQGIDIEPSKTIVGRNMGSVLDAWIDRENKDEGTGWRGYRDNVAVVMNKEREKERLAGEVNEGKLNAKEMAANKADAKMVEREIEWERNVTMVRLEGSYI